jgi:cyclohexadieny/prephenate dehydrogenase
MIYKHIALIGLGLIASSIALSLKKKNSHVKITGTSRSQETREKASSLKICEVKETMSETVMGADLVILCVPVGVMGKIVSIIAPSLERGTTLTDVGSVKLEVISQIQPVLPDHIHFIPAHPIAGTEHSGPESGFSSLFNDRWCLITPLPSNPDEEILNLSNFWIALGARVHQMTPQHHDLVLAVTSHTPHLIAFTMVGVADELENVTNSEIINYSAAGFRDFTRIAASDPTMWRDVFLNNKEAVMEVLGRFTEELFSLQNAIRRDDGEALFEYFNRTRKIRRSIIEAGQDTSEPDFGRSKK